MRKVVILSDASEGFELEHALLSEAGAEVIVSGCTDTKELKQLLKNAYVVMMSAVPITAEIVDALDSCKLIIRYGIGYDNIALEAAKARGIYVCNIPNYGTYDVAEHAFALMLACSRKIAFLDRYVREGKWFAERFLKITRLHNKVIGFIGFGRIAQSLCSMTSAFSMKALAYDPYADGQVLRDYQVQLAELSTLAAESDVISLHAPLNEYTYHMIDRKVFSHMKKTAILINTSRGGLINQDDLIEALASGRIAGAGIDVFEEEPLPDDSPLRSMGHVVLTPHVAWCTEDAIKDLHREAVDNVLRVLHGEVPKHIVNGLS